MMKLTTVKKTATLKKITMIVFTYTLPNLLNRNVGFSCYSVAIKNLEIMKYFGIRVFRNNILLVLNLLTSYNEDMKNIGEKLYKP